MTTRHELRISSLVRRGVPRHLHLYDNGGASADRSTVIYTWQKDGICRAVFMSGAPTHSPDLDHRRGDPGLSATPSRGTPA
jgi:hypothetical protein